MSRVPGVAAVLWRAPYLLLTLTALFWAGNSIVGKAVTGIMPPLTLAFWRWSVALLAVLPLAWPHLKRDLPQLKARWKTVLALGLSGVASFGAILYWGLQYTTALNGVLLQAAIPPLILLAAFLMHGERAGFTQLAGVAVSLVGVVAIVSQGSLQTLAHLKLNIGDAAVLGGVFLYAAYSALLRKRPQVHPLSLLAATFAIASLALLPFSLAELASGRRIAAGPAAIGAIAYVALLSSVGAYLFFNRAVELIGPNRAGHFIHLVPAFGAVLAVLLLHEPFHLYHLAGVALIAAGIGLAAVRSREEELAGDPGLSR